MKPVGMYGGKWESGDLSPTYLLMPLTLFQTGGVRYAHHMGLFPLDLKMFC